MGFYDFGCDLLENDLRFRRIDTDTLPFEDLR